MDGFHPGVDTAVPDSSFHKAPDVERLLAKIREDYMKLNNYLAQQYQLQEQLRLLVAAASRGGPAPPPPLEGDKPDPTERQKQAQLEQAQKSIGKLALSINHACDDLHILLLRQRPHTNTP